MLVCGQGDKESSITAVSSQQRWALELLPRLGTFSIHVTDEKEQARILMTGATKTHNTQAGLKRKQEGAADVAQLAQCWSSTHKGWGFISSTVKTWHGGACL